MDWFTGIVVYFLIWWVSIFAILNIGHRVAESPEMGHDRSAPVKFHLGKKLLLNTAIAAIIWLVIWAFIKFSGISFRQMVEDWQ